MVKILICANDAARIPLYYIHLTTRSLTSIHTGLYLVDKVGLIEWTVSIWMWFKVEDRYQNIKTFPSSIIDLMEYDETKGSIDVSRRR